jgi:hypothetical protein
LFDLVNINNQVAYVPNAAAAGVGGLLTAPTTANTGLADVTQIGGDSQSATDLKDFADAGYDPTTNMSNANLKSINEDLTAIGVLELFIAILDQSTGQLDAGSIQADFANKLADHFKRRTQANTEASSDGDAISLGCLYGLIQQAQESNTTATPGSLTVYEVDGTTVLGTKTVSTDPTADPIDGIS